MDDNEILWQAKMSALRSIQDGIKLLKDCIKTLESKVEEKGISGDYSTNHDCLRYSQKIWAACLRLNELKKLQHQVDGLDSFGLPPREKTRKEFEHGITEEQADE